MRIFIAIIFCSVSLNAQQYTISTIAGSGTPPTAVPAVSVRMPVSSGIARDAAGAIYFNSGNSVFKVDAMGVLTRIAGTGQYGSSGDGGPAINAQLAWPAGLVLDGSGSLFIAENAGHRIRKVSPDGTIHTVAGTGIAGNSGDGGRATGAQLDWPTGIALDATGNLYIADTGNHSIRKVFSDGTIATVATDLGTSVAIAVDASGALYIADYLEVFDDCGDESFTGRILKVAPGSSAVELSSSPDQGWTSPRAVTLDAARNLYVVDSGRFVADASSIFKISPAGMVTTACLGSGFVSQCPHPSTNDPSTNDQPIAGDAELTVDGSGNLYISDVAGGRISRFSPQGVLVTLVGGATPGNYWGDGGPAVDAGLYAPLGVAVDSSGNLFISDTGNSRVRKVSPSGVISTVAGTGTRGYSGDGGPAVNAQLKGPAGLALDGAGNLYIADYLDNRVRKVSAGGTITTVAGRGDTNQPLGDGGLATQAALARPFGVAVDGSGNLYIADTSFFLVRKVSLAGIITTVAGSNYYQPGPVELTLPTGVAVDVSGNLYIATSGAILELSPSGKLTTIAGNTSYSGAASSGDGGPATSATLKGAFGVAVDASGSLYLSEGDLSGYAFNPADVRKITGGFIATIAGNGTSGYSGDNGPAIAASFSAAAAGIAVDANGAIYVADVYNNVIRVLYPSSK